MPDAEADHASPVCGAQVGIGDQVRDERHRADAEREAEERHPDREAHGDQRAERHEQDDHRGDQADQLADPGLGLLEGEEEVAAHLDLQRRARRAARRRTPSGARRSAGLSSSITGYCRRMTATRPSGETWRLGVEHVRQGGGAGLDARPERPKRRVARRPSRGVTTSCAVSPPAPSRPRRACARACCGVGAGHVERVLEVAAEGRRRGDHERRDGEPRADGGVWAAGREAAEPIQGGGHGADRRRARGRRDHRATGHTCVGLSAEPVRTSGRCAARSGRSTVTS